ncbi:structural maintenance of chromosomes protein 5-like [Branchiostoma floridae]|uniref:Structural maintenance of chromosomes protein 5 n=1 Tax=Branchiostoma floridae TaxID=7739 RepID=A0A9J7KNF2_BRAFL|nr:structural maintenance of chromosomes protein 5-like [Branchiostoma floridae]
MAQRKGKSREKDASSKRSERKGADPDSQLSPMPVASSDGFVRGAIVRMKLINFMSYNECEFFPGCRLNVIIAPNHTGKSAMTCAMCLGLGGSTKIVDRGKEVSEYVKHGKETGYIELELHGGEDEDNVVIKRQIHRDNRSDWSLNGQHATQKKVLETVASFNIQINNLCQFLPQHRVEDFAKMDRYQLLENTEKAVGSPQMYEDHCQLKDFRRDERQLSNKLEEHRTHLERLKERNARLELDVKRYRERERHLAKIQILEKKKPWAQMVENQKKFNSAKSKKTECTQRLREEQTKNAPRQKQTDRARECAAKIDQDIKAKQNQICQQTKQCKERSKNLAQLREDITDVQELIKEKKQQESDRIKMLNELKRHLGALQNELQEVIETAQDVTPRINEIGTELRTINSEMRKLHTEKERIKEGCRGLDRDIKRCKDEIRHLEDVRNQRLNLLRQKHRHTYDAVQWLRANRDKFKKTIYEPVMLIMNVPNRNYARYLEHHISYNDMRAFVCEDQEDMNKFLNEVRDNQKLKVNAVKAPTKPVSEFVSKPIQQLRDRYDFQHYLKDLFEAPEPVMAYLCQMYNLQDVPIGTETTKKNIEKVLRESGVRCIYTPGTQYRVSKSRYTGEISSTNSSVRAANLLNLSVDAEQRAQVERELTEALTNRDAGQEQYKELDKKEGELRLRDNRLKQEKKELNAKSKTKSSLEQKIKTKESRIRQYENDAVDLEAAEKEAKEKIVAINDKRLKLVKEFKEYIKKVLDHHKEKVELSMQHLLAMAEVSRLEMEQREWFDAERRLKQEAHVAEQEARAAKDRYKRSIDVVKETIGLEQREDTGELSPPQHWIDAFNQYPTDDLDEIEAMINDTRARADLCFQTDPGVIEEFEKRQRDIAKLSREVDQQGNHLESQRQEIRVVRERWLTPLRELVDRINYNFSRFMSMLECVGEVDLHAENEDDYDKYGVRIRVKFRNASQLHELNPYHQSGGERSVSTILYLMALQGLTRCPFRVVDEINQGMDSTNERRVFDLVVGSACRENTSQYFLISQKLLPDLNFEDNMTVHFIFNGHWMLHRDMWDIKKFLKIRKKFKYTQEDE